MGAKIVPGLSDEDLMEALLDMLPPIRKEGGVTANEFSVAASITDQTAVRRLRKLVDDGVMVAVDSRLESGKGAVIYYPK